MVAQIYENAVAHSGMMRASLQQETDPVRVLDGDAIKPHGCSGCDRDYGIGLNINLTASVKGNSFYENISGFPVSFQQNWVRLIAGSRLKNRSFAVALNGNVGRNRNSLAQSPCSMRDMDDATL